MKRRSAQSPQTFLSLRIPSRSFSSFYYPIRPLTSLRLSSLRLTSLHFLSSHFPHTVPSVPAHKKGKFVRGGQENGPLEHKNDRFVREGQKKDPFAHKKGKFVREGQKNDPFAHKNGKFVREGRKNDPLAHKNSKSVREKRENNPLAHKNGTKTTDSCAKDRETTLSRTKTANPCAREGKKANLRTKTAYLCAKDNHHARKAKAGGKQREGSQNEGQTKRVTNDRHNEKPRDSGETRGLLISDGEGRPEGAERVGSGPEQACGQGHFKTLSSSRRRAFSPSTLRSTILPSRMR